MVRDRHHRRSTAVSKTTVLLFVAFLLAACSDAIAPGPDGLTWLHGCDVGQVTDEGLAPIITGDEFCPEVIEVDATGVIWGASDGGDVRLVAGDRWVRIVPETSLMEWPSSVVIDLAVGTDGRVWLVTGTGDQDERLDVEVRSFGGVAWRNYSTASGGDFGTVEDRFEPPQRILAPLPGGKMALATSTGLYLQGSGRWVKLLSGEFTTVSSTRDGTLWFAGPSGVYRWSSESLPW